GVSSLSNGNYVVRNLLWNGQRGAVTWGSGTGGVTGAVDASNSLVGSSPGDQVGSGFTLLSNGNYVVTRAAARGAATWGNGTTGVTGTVSAANTLAGTFGSAIILLSNGNYVVRSPYWNGSRGAATWVSGTTGQTVDGNGTITPQNSLVG